jgi:hypothetical protein
VGHEKESEMNSRVCGTVVTSYDMSLRDTMMLASYKMGVCTCSALVEQLGGGKNLVAKKGSLTVAQQQSSRYCIVCMYMHVLHVMHN